MQSALLTQASSHLLWAAAPGLLIPPVCPLSLLGQLSLLSWPDPLHLFFAYAELSWGSSMFCYVLAHLLWSWPNSTFCHALGSTNSFIFSPSPILQCWLPALPPIFLVRYVDLLQVFTMGFQHAKHCAGQRLPCEPKHTWSLPLGNFAFWCGRQWSNIAWGNGVHLLIIRGRNRYHGLF